MAATRVICVQANRSKMDFVALGHSNG